MPALNFKEQFADAIETGRKRQTVRLGRKRPIQTGDRLILYTGMRTKQCRKLREVTCQGVYRIVIEENETIRINGVALTPPERVSFARADGFASVGRFLAFFRQRYGLPFEGIIIRW